MAGQQATELARSLVFRERCRFPDHPDARVDLGDSQGGQLTPPRPAVGRDDGHQLVAVAVPPRDQRAAEPGQVSVGGHLGGINPQHRLAPSTRQGHRAVPGLPVHLR